ncbi:glucosaminidase domain-containing protein [Candidatus Roizmanbacteria bacterium]|nr:MAG: glucosaminidase domain-containing protein [Candidatus Roizmanbacteria bacterium]
MVKNIAVLLLLIVLLILPNTVRAEQIAGTSAKLVTAETTDDRVDQYVERNLQKSVIREVLESKKSPLVTEVDAFMDACTTYEIDCYLLPSIAGLESSFGKHLIPESHNPFGWGGGHIYFDSWSDAFHAVAKGLKNNYIGRGAETIEEIGPIYAASPTWAVRVRSIHNEFERREADKKLYYAKLAMSL